MNLEKAKNAIKILYKALLFELMRYKIYNSYVHKALFQPTSAIFNITDNCNSRCITCNAWREKSTNELTTGEVTDILGQLRNLGISNVGFAGGEPLLRKDLPELVQKSKGLGFKHISVMTNGLLLNERKATTLLESGITAIGISIDGIDETHDMIRGIKGAYERSSSALKTLLKLRDDKYSYLNILVATTLTRPNVNQIEDIIEMCDQLNVEIILNLLDTSPYFFLNVDISDLIIKDQKEFDAFIDRLHGIKKNTSVLNQFHVSLEYARKYFSDSKRKDVPCHLGYQTIYIGARGEVYSGCWALKAIGNLRGKKLEEIINSKEYKKRLYNMFMKKCPGCTCGYSTNLLYHIPSICEEILWRTGFKR